EGHFAAWDGHVFFGVRTARDGFFLDELDAFRVRSSARLAVTVALSDEDVPASLATAYPGFAFARGFVHAVAGARMQGRYGDVRVNKSGCVSQCGHGPMIVVYPENVWYAGVRESDLEEILASHIVGGCPVERLRYDPGVKGANRIEAGTEPRPAAPAAVTRAPGWTRVCRADDVPASGMKEFAVGGTSVLIVHTGDAFVAFQAMCPHEAVPLEQGIHDGCVLTCLEHTWQFDLKTGAPVGEAEE